MGGMSDGQRYNSFCMRLALYISTVFLIIFVLPFFILGNPWGNTAKGRTDSSLTTQPFGSH